MEKTSPISQMLNDIASCSASNDGVTRLPFTPEHRAAIEKIKAWMIDSGLKVHVDNAGTVIGRLEGPQNSPTLLLGSHQDTVRNGGRFDGIMGVLLPILALRKIRNITLPYSVQVMAFADEEGVRFPTALIGPRALAGTLDIDSLDLKDDNGISIRDAMIKFQLNPEELHKLDLRNTPLLGYIETHIEQGPVLYKKNLPLGIVTAISGIERHQIILKGVSGHAGTTPMHNRQDTLACAAELVLNAEKIAKDTTDLIATIGKFTVAPNVVNVIPSQVSMVLEVRSESDKIREMGGKTIIKRLKLIAAKRKINFFSSKTYSQQASPCDKHLKLVLQNAISKTGHPVFELPSGATHDASAIADLCPMAMLFVRCHKGISHTPEELTEELDMQAAVDSLAHFLTLLK